MNIEANSISLAVIIGYNPNYSWPVPIYGTTTGQSHVKLSFVSYSAAGDRVVLAEQTITGTNGTILLSGPFQTTDQEKEYALELEAGITNVLSGVHFRAGAIQMNYDSK
ncbi:MAG: hypothetical protein WCK77_25975 [Verrucomicrobiota bacterium]